MTSKEPTARDLEAISGRVVCDRGTAVPLSFKGADAIDLPVCAVGRVNDEGGVEMFDLLDGPSAGELAGIEGEWSVIAAEVAVVDAECRVAAFGDAVSARAVSRAAADLVAVHGDRGGVGVSGSSVSAA